MAKSISINLNFAPRQNFSSILGAIIILLNLYPNSHGYCQGQPKIQLSTGITWRSTAMHVFNFKNVSVPSADPYSYEKNVQGLSLNIGVQFFVFDRIAIEYIPNIRYDVTKTVRGNLLRKELIRISNQGDSLFINFYSPDTYKKELIFDHNINLIRYSDLIYGFGVSIVNSNKSIFYENPVGVRRSLSLEFITANAIIVFPLRKSLNLELKALYVPKNFPEDRTNDFMMYSIRAYYVFSFTRMKNINGGK